jgi:hypothetical protein
VGQVGGYVLSVSSILILAHHLFFVLFISESILNYRWTVELGLALCAEYSLRYKNRIHKTQQHLQWLQVNEPNNLPVTNQMTPVKLAMPDQYKCDDPVASYRSYYVHDKSYFAKWTHRPVPEWYQQGLQELQSTSNNDQAAPSSVPVTKKRLFSASLIAGNDSNNSNNSNDSNDSNKQITTTVPKKPRIIK